MAYHKAPLNLVTKEVEFIKPSKPTPNSPILSMSSLDNRTELNSLSHTVNVYRLTNHNQPRRQDPIQVFKEALSKALLYYFPFAGRLIKHSDGKLSVNCNDDGVPLLEAIANCNLSCVNYLDGENDSEIAKELVFDLFSHDQNGYQYPLVFKVTKFLCGGFTIGMGISHAVCDGIGASQFYRAVIELASGKIEPSVKPVWERERLVGSITKQPIPFPIDEASAAVSPFLPTKDNIVLACFKVDSETMKRLKMSLMKECENESFTRFESLSAYVWRARARALKQSNDGKTLLVITINLRRHIFDPPLPEGYYGNSIVEVRVLLTTRELNQKPLSEVVKRIRESKKISLVMIILKIQSRHEIKKDVYDFNVDGMGAITNLAEWNHLGLLEGMDFGGNELVNMLPAPIDIFGAAGICVFLPPSNLDSSLKGGVRIFVTLPSETMVKFKEEMVALTLLNHFQEGK